MKEASDNEKSSVGARLLTEDFLLYRNNYVSELLFDKHITLYN